MDKLAKKEFVNQITKVFAETNFPTITAANLVGAFQEKQEKFIEVEFQQKCFRRNIKEKFSQLYSFNSSSKTLSLLPTLPIKISDYVLKSISPSLSKQALIVKDQNSSTKAEEFILEIWSNNAPKKLIKAINLSSKKKHEEVLSDIVFGSLCWSSNENKLVYMANNLTPQNGNAFIPAVPKKNDGEREIETQKEVYGEKYEYTEPWGELLTSAKLPVICVVDIESETVSVVLSIPEGMTPARPQWGPNDTIVLEGIVNKPFKLGRIYCENRESSLCSITADGTDLTYLTEGSMIANYSHSISPCKTKMLFVSRKLSGKGDSHRGTEELRLFTFSNKENKEIKAEFPWYIHSFNAECWLENGGAILNNVINAENNAVVLDKDFNVKNVYTCSSILEVKNNIAVLLKMNLDSSKPEVLVLFDDMIYMEESQDNESEYEIVTVTVEGIKSYVLKLKETKPNSPIIVWAHGGPHSLYSAQSYIFYAQVFCKLGYIVLLVNYRGSTGFDDESLQSLPGNVGTQDVHEVQQVAEMFMKENPGLVNRSHIFYFGGSHGGFLGAHVISQYPDFYAAAVLRNPVINIAVMSEVSDIPDWCYVESGVDYQQTCLPSVEKYRKMLEVSPIVRVENIKSPVLLCVGAKDLRVPPSQSVHFYKVLKANGKTVRMLLYPEDSHPLASVETESDVFINTCLWFHEHSR